MSSPSTPAPAISPTNGNGNGHLGADEDEDDVSTRKFDDGYAPEAAKLIIDTLGAKMHFVIDSQKQIEAAIEYLQAGQQAEQAARIEMDKKLDRILQLLDNK